MKGYFLPLYKISFLALLLTSTTYAQTGPGGIGSTDGTSTLNLWLDANQIENVVSGNNVTTWNDQSGYGNHASQSTASSKPNYREDFVNGFPTLTFSGSERLEGTLTGGLQAPATVIAVAYFDSLSQPASDNDFVFSIGSQTGNNTMMGIARCGTVSNSDKFYNKDGSNDNYGPTISGQSWDVCTQIHNSSSPYTELYVNGASQTIDNNMTSALNTNSNYRVGDWADSPGSSWHLTGKVSEVLAYKKELSSAEMNIVNSYLGAKYNISVTNDKYTGDNSGNGDNDRDVIGIGVESDGSNSSASRAGLTVSVKSSFANGDYVIMGHNDETNSINTGDATDLGGTLEARWTRDWFADITNTGANVVVDFEFNLINAGLGGSTSGTNSNYQLLYRSSNTGNWTLLASPSSVGSHTVTFTSVTLSADGYYTLGTTDATNSNLGTASTESSGYGPGGIGETDGTSNLQLWLDADYLEGGQDDPLVNFYDRSGNSASATDFNVSNIPVVKPNAVNGHDAIYFDGTDHIEGDLSTALSANATVVAIGYFDQDQRTGENDYLISLGDATTANRHLSISRRKNDGANRNRYYSWTGTSVIYGPTIDSQEWNIFYQEQLTTGNYHNLYLNGTAQSVSANPASFSATSTKYRLGEWQNQNSSGLLGYVAEVIIFDKQLNSAERNILNSYLGAKYAKTVGGDKYSGDDTGNGDNDREVIGIGTESDGSNTTASAGGLTLTQASNFGVGDYLMAGTASTSNSENTSDISHALSSLESRWDKTWWIDVTDAGSTMTANVTLDFSDAGDMGFPDDGVSNYKLLYRSSSSGQWSYLATASSINGDQVIFTGVSFAADGFYTLGTTSTLLAPLPVKLVQFSAEPQLSSVLLKWKTSTEKDNRSFVIERSVDSDSWEAIGEVQGAGNSQSDIDYDFSDIAPTKGVSYYRLKQIDFNGESEYSTVRSVAFHDNGENIQSVTLSLFPNPSAGKTNLQLKSNKAFSAVCQILVYNLRGELVHQQSVSVREDNQFVELDLQCLEAGFYLVELKSDDHMLTNREALIIRK